MYPKYSENVLWWGSLSENIVKAPVLTFPASRYQRSNPDSVLASFEPGCRALSFQQKAERDSRVDMLKKSGKTIYDETTYVMNSMVVDPVISLHCGTGKYFDTIGSCTALVSEFYSKTPPDNNLANLPLRNEAHKNCTIDPIVDGSARSAAIGLSTLIVYQDTDGTYKYFVRRRSEKVAQHPGALHVLPASMFQPKEHLSNPEREFSVVQNVKCEYLEELFNIREENVSRDPARNSISLIPEGKYLEEMLADPNRAQLLFTGVAMDLSNLRPEICTLLLIQDQEWIQKIKGVEGHKPMQMNWEYSAEIPFDKKGQIPLDAPIIKTLGPVTDFVPVGAAAVSLGIKVALEEI